MSKIVLITGASKGIGAGIATLFSEKRYHVILHYNESQKQVNELKEKLLKTNPHVWTIKADIRKEDEIKSMFQLIKKQWGGVDILINNAGIARINVITAFSADEWDNMFAVNVRGAFLCIKEAIPMMLEKGKGNIINVSSMWGISGSSCEVCYSASKAALINMTKSLAKELGPSNIRVNCVAPGVIDTEMNHSLSEQDKNDLKEQTPLMRMGTVEDVAQGVIFLAEESSKFMTGQIMSIDGGFIL